jgi:uncharacterized protein
MPRRPAQFWPVLLGRWRAMLWGMSLLALPFVILLPLGVLWLWQHGWLLWWALGAAVLAFAGYLPAFWPRLRIGRRTPTAPAGEEAPVSDPGEDWSPRDLAAWEEVQSVAASVDRDIVTNRDRLFAVARQTIERVAKHYHPEDRDPIWSFTVPELMLLTERVSIRLRVVLLDHVPGVHLVEAGTLLRLWEYKPVAATGLRVFRHLHNAWRVTRLANPMAALLAEARKQLVGATLAEAGDYLRSRGARIWVEEVGRAAIELYSGRLRLDTEELHALAARQETEPVLPGPLRILVAGRVNAGKSSLVNALLGEPVAGVAASRLTTKATGYRLQRDDLPEGLLVDTPGLRTSDDFERLAERTWESDLLLWVASADAPSRALDRGAMAAIRARFDADPRRSMIPILVVLAGVDRLPPAEQWHPPYDLERPGDPKAASIRAAVDAVAGDLGIDMQDVVAARLEPPEQLYNVDLVRALLGARHREARRCRAQRLQMEAPPRDWKRVLRQAAGAGRLLRRRVIGQSP